MKALVFLFVFLSTSLTLAQVGINTTNPNAKLDIRSSNVATPANTDGILIPKIDEYPTINPTAAQDGMMVFVTGNGSVSKGFYFWNNSTTSWVSIVGNSIEKIDDLTDGKSDNDGTDNGSSIFLGLDAGANDDGTDNRSVGIGFRTLENNTNAFANTAVGYEALANNTAGSNTAVGYNALVNNTTGGLNTAIGRASLSNNEDGGNNTAIGYASLFNNTSGNNNVAFGRNALVNNTTGVNNVAIGYYAINLNTTENNNTAIGNFSGLNSTGSNNVFLGYYAGFNVASNDRLYIENSLSSSPLIYGEFDNDFLRVNGDIEVRKGTNASASVVTPFGFQSSLKLFERGTSGDFGFEFQYDGSPDKLYLWSRTFAGNEGIRMTWLKDGKVGMNDTSPDARLDIEAMNQATPTNTDGLLIPRIDTFPAANPGVNQNGMLVFLTADNSFYYWNNTTTTWINIINSSNSVERINDLADGKSDNDGSDNGSSVFLGLNAGANDNETNNYNVGVGYFALNNNISGAANTAVGSTALINNTSGSNNSAFGRRALYWSTTGSGNSAFGSLALEENTQGYSNMAAGYEALTENTIGYHNTAVGYEAMESNTSGYYNTALGYESLRSNSSGHSNIAIGYESLELNTIGAYNTAVGFDALENNTSGSRNIAMGFQASESNITGRENIAIGYDTMLNNSRGSYNTAIGFEALVNLDGNQTLNYGIYNTALGYQALSNTTSGSNNTAVGRASGPVIGTLSNTTALGYGAVPLASNTIRIGNASITQIGGFSAWSNFSDRRLKTNIQENIIGLEFIKKLRPVSYTYDMDAIAQFEKTPEHLRLRDAELLKSREVQTGFIAQEVEQAAQDVGFDFHGIVKPYDENGTYALRYAEFVVPLVKAMQEQQSIIETQQEELVTLRKEIEAIKTLLRKE